MKPVWLLTLLLPGVALGEASSSENWHGEYAYYASYGKTVGGSHIGAEYNLKLSKGQPSCEIEVSGFQTLEEIVCVPKLEGNEVVLLFKSYKSGDTKNIYGVAVYQPNQPLLKLERTMRNGRPVLLTHWLGMEGLDGKKPKPGEHFKLVGNKR